MRLCEFFDVTLDSIFANPEGTFISAKLTKDSELNIIQWMKDNKLKHREPRNNLHVTILIDKSRTIPWKPVIYDPPIEAMKETYKLEKFGEDLDVIVLTFAVPELEKRHNMGKKKFDIVPSFRHYIPHVTLSYDPGHTNDINKLLLPTFPILIDRECVAVYNTENKDEG